MRSIPIVVWTTSSDEVDRMQCLQAGADSYVAKPMRFGELVGSLRQLIVKYATADEAIVRGTGPWPSGRKGFYS